MNTLLKLTATITTSILLSAPAMAGTGVSEMASICKAGALSEFAKEEPTRVKFKGVSGPRSAKQVRLQIFPQAGGTFDATCELNTKTGEILALTRQS
ncbi:hypothetical protein [Litorivivens sp.]|uniref:hypothetical protein n=1 Tax=Litorivivens sp. TaxID=2020868 RepID=UPI003567DEF4